MDVLYVKQKRLGMTAIGATTPLSKFFNIHFSKLDAVQMYILLLHIKSLFYYLVDGLGEKCSYNV